MPFNQPLHILLIENNPSDAELIRELLSEATVDTKSAQIYIEQEETLLEGVRRYSENEGTFDIILLDLGLPDSQGLETFTKLVERASHIPIIVLTGLDDVDLAVETVRRGAQDYLVKGHHDGDILLRAIRYAVERKRAEQTYRAVFEGVNDAIFILDAETGACLDVNPRASELFGYTADEYRQLFLGERIADTSTKEGARDALANVQRGISHAGQWQVRDKSGRAFWIDVNVTHVVIGGRPCIVAAARDITELKRAHDELEQIVKERTHELQEEIEEHKVTEGELRATTEDLQELTEELREKAEELIRSNKELEQFAYIASHDLQEPLRTVTSSLGLLENWYKGKLSAEADTFIGYAVDGAKRMQQLIRDLLAYSRVTSRGEAFIPVHCEDVVQHVIDNLKVAIEESGATITLPKQPLPTVMGDKTQLIQLFQNLISNAIKFRGEEPPHIYIGGAYDASQREWQFSVNDNGMGFDMHYKDKIFTIFQRLHTQEEYEGTGMGLALCKKIVERHDGEIWVESKVGKGSTFYFTIPHIGRR